jgi:hypothetical protein
MPQWMTSVIIDEFSYLHDSSLVFIELPRFVILAWNMWYFGNTAEWNNNFTSCGSFSMVYHTIQTVITSKIPSIQY